MATFNTRDRTSSVVRINEPPVTHTGFLKKQGQKRQNWKRRYVVVELGRLTYFEKSNGTTEPPYGLVQKGAVTLNGYEVMQGPGKLMLLLKHRIEKRELLVEVEKEGELAQWRTILEDHIQFCNENPTLFLQVDASFNEDEAKRAATAQRFRAAADADAQVDEEEDDSIGALSAPKPIHVNPGFVIKTRRMNDLKVFLNVCDHEDIPQSDKKRGNKRWPIFVLSPTFKISVDKKAETCNVLDICVHPSVMQECAADTTGETKDEVCLKIMDAIIQRERREKVPSLIDKSVFSFPRIATKYKGDADPVFLLPRNLHSMMRKSSILEAIDVKEHLANLDAVLQGETLAEEGAKKTNESADDKEEEKEQELKLSSPSGAPKKYIRLCVVRPTGAVLRAKPEKAAPRLQHTLLQNSHAYCYGRRVTRDGSCWYRLLEGWTPALTDGGQRILRPDYMLAASKGQAQQVTHRSAALLGFNMVETHEKGLFFDKIVKKLTFSVQLSFSADQDSVLLLQRSYDEFMTLRKELQVDGNLQQDVEFPLYASEALAGDDVTVDLLLDLLYDLSAWLERTMQGAAASCAAMKQFMEPTEADCRKMDVDLSATGGLGGSWPAEYT